MTVEEILWSTSKNSVEEYTFIDKDTVTFECSDNSSFYNVSNNHGTIVASNIDTNVIEIVSNNKNVLKLRAKVNDTLYDKDGGYFTWYIHNVDSKEYGSQGYSLKVKLIAKPNVTKVYKVINITPNEAILCNDVEITVKFKYLIDETEQSTIPDATCYLRWQTFTISSVNISSQTSKDNCFTVTLTIPKTTILDNSVEYFNANISLVNKNSTCSTEGTQLKLYKPTYKFFEIDVTK